MKILVMSFLWLILAQPVAYTANMAPDISIATVKHSDTHDEENLKPQIWTCSMHPQIKSDKPGRCPICGMDLIPAGSLNAVISASDTILTLSASAAKLAEIETAPVVRKEALAEVRLVGKIKFNETRNVTISAKFPGRIEKLYLNFVEAPISKNEHIAEIFSPELAVLQRELILTKKSLDGGIRDNLNLEDRKKTFDAAVNKARLWGVTENQIDEILKRGTVSMVMTVYSPVYGIVKEQKVLENQYFKEGDVLFVISDLSTLWLMLDAYEQDLPFIHYGQKVEFFVQAFPGRKFYGTVAYINPTVDETTRTTPIKVILDNRDGKLKPGMFARATLFAHMGADGQALPENMDGKWICPMHHEIISDEPVKCPICYMPLESAEKLGLSITKTQMEQLPLLIPYTAPLITGKRAVVYVEIKQGQYEGREITIGPKVGNYYIVERGLKEGEHVVVKGNFKIDSELQIQAKPSMMGDGSFISTIHSACGGSPTVSSSHESALSSSGKTEEFILQLWVNYFKIQKSLASDDLNEAKTVVTELKKLISQNTIDASGMNMAGHQGDTPHSSIDDALSGMSGADDINDFRKDFKELTVEYEKLLSEIKKPSSLKVYEYYCPMAFDNKGAIWFQDSDNIANPYFGKEMPGCGELKNTHK